MSDQTKSRFAIDLDDLERQLRQTAGGQPKAAAGDPLAELARIVGQDDPFKAIFNDKRPPTTVAAPALKPTLPSEAAPRRAEPSLDELLRSLEARSTPVPPPAAAPAGEHPAGSPPETTDAATLDKAVLDEFDAMLRDELRAGETLRATPDAVDAAALRLDPAGLEPVGAAMAPADEAARDFETRLPEARDLDEMNARDAALAPTAPADYPEPPAEPVEDMRSLEPQQPRKGLVIAGALLGVAVLGIGSVVGLRGFGGSSSAPRPGSEPPVIRAEAGPAKVQPQNPGGVEIPNQNKQIYERGPDPRPGETRVVTREEQPIDVQAAARATPRVILPGPGGQASPAQTTTATVPAGSQAAPGLVAVAPATVSPPADPNATLGEPRRVRTVAVRPDGTIAGAPPAPTAAATTAATPPAARQAPAATPTAQPRPATAPAPAPRAAATDDTPAARPAAQTRQQVAAAPATAAVPASTPAPREAPAGGGFMVQLGAPGSEAEARSTFAAMQRRYGDALSGEAPVIRRADVGGRTVYRLRIGPFSRGEAAEKCQAIQAAGGQCFIAGN
jgi:hypothetical protein